MDNFTRNINPRVKPCHICGKGLVADGKTWMCINRDCNYFGIEIFESDRYGEVLELYKGDN